MESDDDFAEDEDYTYEEDGEYDDEYDAETDLNDVTDSEGLKSNEVVHSSGGSSRRTSRGGDPNKELTVPLDSYTIVDTKEIEPIMTNFVDDVSGLLDIPPDATLQLLQHSRWDKEKLMDAFFSDPDKVKKEAGLDLYSSINFSLLRNKRQQNDKSSCFKCRICCDNECDTNDSFALGCHHSFCKSCFGEYLRIQLGDGQTCVLARCPEHKCRQAVTQRIFHAFLGPTETTRYDNYYVRNFIENSKCMKYCPAPGCEKVAMGTGITTVLCSCGHPFCFRCGEEAHDPCSCAQLSEWVTKCHNESETANWILANTHKCPNCSTRIEKNQGCNHMTCRLCKHEFCWMCMGNWSEHGQATGGFYKCNRFDSGAVSTTTSSAEKAKAELDRYLHYFQRYHGHDRSLKFAATQREQAEERMVEQQESHKSSWIDVQFLKQAAEQVIACRRVLKYTYVLGFYLVDKSPEKQLFEHHQEMLEKNTEKLQEYTEQKLDDLDRTQVVNLTRVTEKFMESLLASTTGGVVT